eukprot:1453820-Pleurochrysis_carterae.AAC.1
MRANRLRSSRLITPTPSRPRKLTASLLPCSSSACPLQRPRSTVGTPFALGSPLDYNAQAVRLASSKPCVGGNRPNRSLSTVELASGASYAAHFDSTTPLNVAVGSGAHFSQLARAASALDSCLSVGAVCGRTGDGVGLFLPAAKRRRQRCCLLSGAAHAACAPSPPSACADKPGRADLRPQKAVAGVRMQ